MVISQPAEGINREAAKSAKEDTKKYIFATDGNQIHIDKIPLAL
jgi:hypothetical protein